VELPALPTKPAPMRHSVILTASLFLPTPLLHSLATRASCEFVFSENLFLFVARSHLVFSLVNINRHNNRVRRIDVATGAVTTIAGTGVSAYGDDIGTRAAFFNPTGIRLSPDNAFAFVSDTSNL
jgi:hypothetical protein